MEKARIMLVEDEAVIANDLKWRLEDMGYDVPFIIAEGETAVKKVKEVNPDLILMDIVLVGPIDGIETAEQIRSIADIPIIYITAYADEETLERAKITEPFGYLIKPVRNRDLHIAIKMALYKHAMEKESKESKKWFSSVLNSICDGVITADTSGRVMYMNPVAEKLTGWNQEDAVGNELEEVFNIKNKAAGETAAVSIKRGTENEIILDLTNDILLMSKDGTEVSVNINSLTVKDEKDNVNGFVFAFRNITG